MTNDDRRTIDTQWRKGVDEKLREGSEKFDSLAAALETNTGLTIRMDKRVDQLGQKLEQHIIDTGNFREELKPLVESYSTIQPGIQVMGAIGIFGGFIARWTRRFVVWIAPFVAVIGGIIAWFHFGGNK